MIKQIKKLIEDHFVMVHGHKVIDDSTRDFFKVKDPKEFEDIIKRGIIGEISTKIDEHVDFIAKDRYDGRKEFRGCVYVISPAQLKRFYHDLTTIIKINNRDD